MWCSHCRADVAAELSTDNRRLLCARCGTELGLAVGSVRPGSVHQRSAELQHDARELLARWKAEAAPRPPVSQPHTTPVPPAIPGEPGVTWRIDPPHRAGQPTPAAAELPAETFVEPVLPAAPAEPAEAEPPIPSIRMRRSRRRRRLHRVDRPSYVMPQDPAPVPHVELPPVEAPRQNWSVFAGQLCAYIGVGLSTCGTALVLWAYFGGPEFYAPSGWLLTTFGQMLLFLGVVMLVSGGMEQTQREVALGIERLGDRLLRVEFAHGPHELPGPHFDRKRPRPGQSLPESAELDDLPVASD